MIRIAFSCVFYPVAMGKYFLSALNRRNDVEVWSVGPYTHTWIPWNGGMYIPERYCEPPTYPLAQSMISMMPPFSYIEGKLPWKPDVWISFDAGWNLSTKPNAGIVVRIQSDPHVLKGWYRQTKNLVDVDFCMQSPYIEAGEHFLPYAYDPTVHYSMHLEKEYDACLIGLHYQQRDALVNRLRSKGISVYYSIGEVYDENRVAYNKAKVALSWSSLQDLPARFWEGLGMGLPVVTNRVPDLDNFFMDGEHYLGFNDINEAQVRVQDLLNSEELRKRIGIQGNEKVQNVHTWDARVQTVLKTIGVV